MGADYSELAIQSFRSGIWNNEILASKRKEELLAWAESERTTGQCVHLTSSKELVMLIPKTRCLGPIYNCKPDQTRQTPRCVLYNLRTLSREYRMALYRNRRW